MIRPLVCILAALFWVHPAAAQPAGDAVAQALISSLVDAGFERLTTGAVQQDARVTIIPALTGTRRSDGAPLSIAAVSVVSGTISTDGSLSADGVRFDQLSLGTLLRVEVAVFESVRFRRGLDARLVPEFTVAAVNGLRAQSGPGAGLSLTGLRLARTRSSAVGGIALAGRLDGLALDPSLLPPTAADRLSELGLSPLILSLDGAGHWNPLAGLATLDALTLSVANAGELTLSASARGVTPKAIRAMSHPDATVTERLSATANIVVERLALTFVDNGVSSRLLDDAAAKQGISSAALAARLVAEIPNTPERADLKAALATFLKTPKALALTTRQGLEIPLLQLLSLVLLDPAQLASLLTPSATIPP